MLDVPYLQIAGALALLWIGAQLLVAKEDDDQIAAHGTLLAAIRTILLADAVMSIDNVIAVASAADRAPAETRLLLLVVGLATSIPLIVAGSTMLMKVMQRFPIIVTLGAGPARLAGRRPVRDRPGGRALVQESPARRGVDPRRRRRGDRRRRRPVAAPSRTAAGGGVNRGTICNADRLVPIPPCR